MHPHIADFIVKDRIDDLMGEATRARLARTVVRSTSDRPGWRARVAAALRRMTDRRGLGSATRHA